MYPGLCGGSGDAKGRLNLGIQAGNGPNLGCAASVSNRSNTLHDSRIIVGHLFGSFRATDERYVAKRPSTARAGFAFGFGCPRDTLHRWILS